VSIARIYPNLGVEGILNRTIRYYIINGNDKFSVCNRAYESRLCEASVGLSLVDIWSMRLAFIQQLLAKYIVQVFNVQVLMHVNKIVPTPKPLAGALSNHV